MIKLLQEVLHEPIVIGILLLLLATALVYSKKIAWWLFSFDKEVEKLLFQKKSSEVRLGKVTEVLSPFLEDFPVDVKKQGTSTVFLGQPVDFLHIDPDEGITFIEVKSGDARLSAAQKKIRKLVEEGQVRWESYQVRGKKAG